MVRQSVLAQKMKKKRGPPPTGKGVQVVVRVQPKQLAEIDAWIAAQPEPRPTRAEALRQFAELALAAGNKCTKRKPSK
jgi:hypothetical protein